jgi:amidase
MKRLSREWTVPLEKRYQVREPVAEVELGETFVVETINFRTPIIRTAADANPAQYREREETGPVFIQGIRPGDALAIHLEAIQPVGHASGGWWDAPGVNSFLEIANGRVHFPGGLWAPRRLMIGDIYVTPEHLPCPNPWDNGGNMDFKDVAPGHALCLQAQLEGGLLVLGDVHAAQGDGEILGLAAECAADVTLRVTRDETFLSERPLVVKPQSFIALACREDYVEARDLAVKDATAVLSRLTGCTEKEAYLYVTTVGDLRNGAVWYMGHERQPPLVVGVEVPIDIIGNYLACHSERSEESPACCKAEILHSVALRSE